MAQKWKAFSARMVIKGRILTLPRSATVPGRSNVLTNGRFQSFTGL
jgi:hypothetical protein